MSHTKNRKFILYQHAYKENETNMSSFIDQGCLALTEYQQDVFHDFPKDKSPKCYGTTLHYITSSIYGSIGLQTLTFHFTYSNHGLHIHM